MVHLCEISKFILFFFCFDLSTLCVWNVANGKITERISFKENEIIAECFAGEFILIATKNIQKHFDLVLRIYSYHFEVNTFIR